MEPIIPRGSRICGTAAAFRIGTESDQGRAGASSPSAGLGQSGLSQSDESLDSQDDGTKKTGRISSISLRG